MARIQQVKKRDGRVVDFDPHRIENAIQQASIATNSHLPNLIIDDITRLIIEETEEKFIDKVPGVEDIQDVVEQKLVENNFFDVAKAYILYRREREEIRRLETLDNADKTGEDWINVKKRDGSLKKFDNEEIRNTLTKFSKDIDATLNDGSNDFYIIKDAPLTAGSTIQLAGGGQKIVLEENDLIKVKSSSATNKVDVIMSLLEIT